MERQQGTCISARTHTHTHYNTDGNYVYVVVLRVCVGTRDQEKDAHTMITQLFPLNIREHNM